MFFQKKIAWFKIQIIVRIAMDAESLIFIIVLIVAGN